MATRKSRKTWMESCRFCQVTSCSAIPGSELDVRGNSHTILALFMGLVCLYASCMHSLCCLWQFDGSIAFERQYKRIDYRHYCSFYCNAPPLCLKASC